MWAKKITGTLLILALLLCAAMPTAFAAAVVHFTTEGSQGLELANLSEQSINIHENTGNWYEYAYYPIDGSNHGGSGEKKGGLQLSAGQRMIVSPSDPEDTLDFSFNTEWLDTVISIRKVDTRAQYHVIGEKGQDIELTNPSKQSANINEHTGNWYEYAYYPIDGSDNGGSGEKKGGLQLSSGQRMVISPADPEDTLEFSFNTEWLGSVIQCKNLTTGETYTLGSARTSGDGPAPHEETSAPEWTGVQPAEGPAEGAQLIERGAAGDRPLQQHNEPEPSPISREETAPQSLTDVDALKTYIEERDNGILALGDASFATKYNPSAGNPPYKFNGEEKRPINCVWLTRNKVLSMLGENPQRASWVDGKTYGEYTAAVYRKVNVPLGGKSSVDAVLGALGNPAEGSAIVLYMGSHTMMIDAIVGGQVYYTDNREASDAFYSGTPIQTVELPLEDFVKKFGGKSIQDAVVLTKKR